MIEKKKRTQNAFVTCVDLATIFLILVLFNCMECHVSLVDFADQKRRAQPNPLISQPTTTSVEAAVGAFCSTSTCDLAMPYLWHPGSTSRHGLGHLELVEILPCLGGGKRWVYLCISHKNIGENPGITQVFWWEMVQLCGKTHGTPKMTE